MRRWAAEALGTFALVFVGCGAVATCKGPTAHLAIQLAFGFVIMAMITALGSISSAHFNPAVTFGLAVSGRFSWKDLPGYWIAQFAGAILGAAMLWLLIPELALAAVYGATVPHLALGAAFGVEVVVTFLLMLVIMGSAGSPFAALAIGLTVAFCGLVAGPLTGNSMNPARSFGPALFAGSPALAPLWLYFAAPLLGAGLAALSFKVLHEGARAPT